MSLESEMTLEERKHLAIAYRKAATAIENGDDEEFFRVHQALQIILAKIGQRLMNDIIGDPDATS